MGNYLVGVDIPVIDPEDYTPDPTEIPEAWVFGTEVTETRGETREELVVTDDAKLIAENQVYMAGLVSALIAAVLGLLVGMELLKIWINT